MLVGNRQSDVSTPAWKQAYRAIDHGFAKNQCSNKALMAKFPPEIQDFATAFVNAQDERHAADYDPGKRFKRTQASRLIDLAEVAIQSLRSAPTKDRRAFAVLMALKLR